WTDRRPEGSFFTLMLAPWVRASVARDAPRPPRIRVLPRLPMSGCQLRRRQPFCRVGQTLRWSETPSLPKGEGASFALARLRRHREEFIYPRLPQRLLAGGDSGSLIAIEIETDRHHHRPAADRGAEVGDAWPRLVEVEHDVVRILVGGLHDAAERRDTSRGGPTLPGANAFQPQCGGQGFPGVLCGSRGHRIPLHDRRALTTEVRKVQPQDAEEARPPEFG